ncbi:M23 family metallopeptidase [Glutamicibacter arilaitensis]|uniref:M23 family metallopeptidase n=1 Tax=Glutamicibacter arilaitensis TaxID=256701 RepID=UPI00384B8F58
MKKKYLLLLIQTLLVLSLVPLGAKAQPADSLAQPTAAAVWRWPLAGEPKILNAFDKPAEKWSAGHRGVDLAAVEGTQVIAPNRGRITFLGVVVDRPVLVIDHGYGFKTSLEPVTSELSVGSWVESGAKLGTVAKGAHCSGRCIHWGVRLDGEYIDPALLIEDLRPSILLPLND